MDDQRIAEPGEPTGPASDAPQRPPGTLKIGQIGGVDVLVRSSWLLVAAIISVMLAPAVEQVEPGLGAGKYVAGLAFAVLLYLSVLLHEASHALMAQHYGLPVRSITLHFLGGVTEIDGEPDTPGREFGVSVVGPLTSLAVGVAALPLAVLAPDSSLLDLAAKGLAGANLVVGVLNLVPGLPLDGGRVLRALVWKITGSPHQGTVVAGWGGRVAALLVLAYPLRRQFLLGAPADITDYVFAFVIASFLWSGASASIMSARVRRRLPALQARTLARRTLMVPDDLPLAEAVRRAQDEQAGSIVVLDATGARARSSTRPRCSPPPRTGGPGSRSARSPAPSSRDSRSPADIAGEPLILAMQKVPASEYLLVDGDGSIFGVLVTDDVDKAFAAGI